MRAVLEDFAGRRRRSRLSRCHPARRTGPAGMGSHAQGGRVTPLEGRTLSVPGGYAWGPLSRIGLASAFITALLDQASKIWILEVFDLKTRGAVRVTPFLDLVLTWNKGISYGLFQQDGALGQWTLLAIKAAAVALLWVWLARATSLLTALSLGLIIGG